MCNKIIYNSCFYISFYFIFFRAKPERKICKTKRIINLPRIDRLQLDLKIPRNLNVSRNKDRNEFSLGSLWEKAEGTGRKLPFLRCVI